MLPHRDWYLFYSRTLERLSDDNSEGPQAAKWTEEHYEYSILGDYTQDATHYYSWKTIARPRILSGEPEYILIDGMDEVLDFGITLCLSNSENTAAVTQFEFAWEALHRHASQPWDEEFVTGRYYDGGNQWNTYPMYMENLDGDVPTLNPANLPYTATLWMASHQTGVNCGNDEQADLFRNGVVMYLQNYVPGTPFGVGDSFKARVDVHRLRVNFLNPVVNTLSRRAMTTVGGVSLILRGLGFNQSDAELNDTSRNPNNDVTMNWTSDVDEIRFEGQQGQGNYTLLSGAGDFEATSDIRIFIPTMPAMARGTYRIRLRKMAMPIASGEVVSYAGRWRADETGLVTYWGEPYSFFVGTPEELKAFDTPKKPLGFFEWAWKFAGELEWKYYAPIDVSAPETFWEGRVLGVGGFTRSIDDFTGMFEVSDVSVDLASNDFEFQKMLGLGHCKNQCVKISHGWADEPASWRNAVLYTIVDDYNLEGPNFHGSLKDITQKYFRRDLPADIITEGDFPNAHPNAMGQPMPELLGKSEYTGVNTPGAIEAHCVNTVTFLYLAAAHPLHSITAVYSDSALVNPANYAVVYDADGRTYIDFTADQGNNKVTFNCTGYSFPPWNSANGYIENPAYILLFYLTLLLQIPASFIHMESFEEMADYFEDNAWQEAGKLALTAKENASDIARTVLFSFGIKMWPDRYGRMKVGRFDLSDITTDIWFWAQTDLMGPANRKYNLRDTVNRIKLQWDYFPAPSLFNDADVVEMESSVDDYEAEIEPSETWDMPCVRDSGLVAQRVEDDLRRLSHGYRSVEFSLSIEHIGRIDVFDKFMLQDPYGVSPTGSGEEWHLYYVTSLTYNFNEGIIDIVAFDLQWLAGQCFIIGRCEDVAHNWSNASEWMKMFGYVGSCDTDSLPGGDPLKKICKCKE